jgi:thiol-disulfide isomerase/thioredoxin
MDNGRIKTIIRGSFPELQGKSVVLSEFDANSAIPVDTVKIKEDGSFSFRFKRSGPGFYLVKTDNRNFITLVIDKESRIELFCDQSNIRKSYSVKGSPDSELYRDYEMLLEVNRNKVDSLSKTYKDYQRSSTFRSLKPELDDSYRKIFDDQRRNSIRFIENHCNSLASLLIVNRRFGERKILTEENDFEYFAMVDSCLSAHYPGNKHLVEFQKRLKLIRDERRIIEMTDKRLAIGNKIPDIGLQDPSGKTIQLHSLLGKPVVLYFWASWDKQSRAANKTLSALAAKTGKSKLNIYAIGLESYKEPWTEAIRADGLQNWIHVTDFLNIYSSAKTLFNIPDHFPYFFYLDENLIIKYKGNDFKAMDSVISTTD